jgi:NTE family protein
MKRRAFLALPIAVGTGLSVAAAKPAGATALVLGGGGCRGYGHIGVLRALERERLQPDLVVGSSSGAVVGALYAGGLPIRQLAHLGERLSENLIRDWIFPRLGLFSGKSIARFVREHVSARDIEALAMRFAAVATDLRNGQMVLLDRGDLGTAVRAASSLPGLLEPVRIGKSLCVDGNLCSPVPVRAARALGARRVVAVDVTFPPDDANLADPFDALYQAFSILTRRLALEERAGADLVLEPPIPDRGEMSEKVIREHIEAGETVAMNAMPELRRLFAGK